MGAAGRFYRRESAALAQRFRTELRSACQLISEFPDSGSPAPHGGGPFLLPRFPFAVGYVDDSDRVEIIAEMHQHRRPGYWKERLDGG